MLYSLWYSDAWCSYTFLPGMDRPLLADGSPQEEDAILVWSVEAATWEDALAARDAYLGWDGHPAGAPDLPHLRIAAD